MATTLSPPPIASTASIEGLQYLRGLAAMMVVFHHARWYFPPTSSLYTSPLSEIGTRGVDIFFVISGFVMAYSTQALDPTTTRARQAIQFYIKRLIRVVPLYWIATAIVIARPVARGQGNLDMLRDVLFIPHLNTQGLIWPYLFQGWTINYEMFFYALFALAMMFGRKRILAISAALLLLVVAGLMTPLDAQSVWLRFYTSPLLFEFLVGIWLCASLQQLFSPLSRPLLLIVAMIGFVALTLPNSDQIRGFLEGTIAILIVGSCIELAAGTEWRWLGALGDASYSIYLFHMTFFGAASRLFKVLGLIAPTTINIVLVIALYLTIAATLGLVIHTVVEKPLLIFLKRQFSRMLSHSLIPRPQEKHARLL